MQYRINPKNGDSLSSLAFGCMRFAKDEKEVARQVAYAIEQGVNYFDTAYVYPNNEAAVAKALSGGLREKVKLATKLPPYMVKKREDFDKLFSTQLKRLKTDRVDYYLAHMLTKRADWERLVSLGMLDWLAEKKFAGAIVNFGFSFHGRAQDFIEIVDAHAWDFCMIQYNYLDENNQAGTSGLLHASSKGMPVMVMEPLRGGKLAGNLPKRVMDVWNTAPVKRSMAEWALRWVLNHPEVTTVLSGMNTMEMLQENIRVASEAEAGSLSEEELRLFSKARRLMLSEDNIPCTGCSYCTPCPAGVDIPFCFSCYNDIPLEGKAKARFNYTLRARDHNASLCTKCGKCETHCPQSIAIRDKLALVSKTMETITYRPMLFVAKKIMKV